MQWFFENDYTPPVFTAEQHIHSGHVSGPVSALPPRAVAFCLGRGLPVLQERFQTHVLMDALPGFISHSPALTIAGNCNVCFHDGGRGAPQAACYAETLHALGVQELLVVGLCGAFGEDVNVGDVLLPRRLLVEEGASRHYSAEPVWAVPEGFGPSLGDFLAEAGFTVKKYDTVTTDAVYRQTYYKEALWREKGCAGVDMEASAYVSLCNYYGMKCRVALMASDKHPLTPNSPPWDWGSLDFRSQRDNFIEACVQWAIK